MPKKFIFILLVFQAALTFLYWIAYKLLVLFFPFLAPYQAVLLTAIILTSFSFYVFAVASHYHQNILFRVGYIVSSIIVVLGFYFLLFSAVGLIIYMLTGWSLQTLGLICLSSSILLTTYGIINARIIQTIEIKVKLPNLPEAWKSKVAVMASDIHLGEVLKYGTVRKVVKKINHLKPDIIFIPGDVYDGDRTDFQKLANEFKHLKAELGVYFSSGNHELYAGYNECEQSLKHAGIKILEDQKIEIEGMQIFGLAYKTETEHTVFERLQSMGVHAHKPSILLKHVPSHIHSAERAGINFQLSGHTHHAQIWPFRYLSKKVYKGYDYGLKSLGKLQIYTSSGVGTWGPPVRVFTKSEIIKITFE